jgi:hypothetical protein
MAEETIMQFKNRAGRWDLEGMRLELTSIITRRREETKLHALAAAAAAMNFG